MINLPYLTRRVAGVLKGMLVLILKAKCGLRKTKKRENLGAKSQVFQNTVYFKARSKKKP